jgi:murein L,D-transpeptidase YafK
MKIPPMLLDSKFAACIALCATVGALLLVTSAFAGTSRSADRVAQARPRVEPILRERCEAAGFEYPPAQLFLRAFKHELELEVWAGDGRAPLKLLWTAPVTGRSGGPGPKRRQGDLQVPEGCYRVAVFNPASKFHLSLGLDYPNASDRILSDRARPGGDIYIHGGSATIGCLPLGDDGIEELYLLANDFRKRRPSTPIPVHIFPARMAGATWEKYREAHAAHAAFWAQLEPVFSAFESSRRVPAVKISEAGAYALAPDL